MSDGKLHKFKIRRDSSFDEASKVKRMREGDGHHHNSSSNSNSNNRGAALTSPPFTKVKRESEYVKKEEWGGDDGFDMPLKFMKRGIETLNSVKREADRPKDAKRKEPDSLNRVKEAAKWSSELKKESDFKKSKSGSDSMPAKVKTSTFTSTSSAVKVTTSSSSMKVKREESSGVGTSAKKKVKDEPEKKERKVYSLPGQKHDPPEERDPLRIFYESLYKQKPESEMAEVWMMEHGLLPEGIAKKALERKHKRQLNQKLGTPVKSSQHVSTVVKSEKKTTTTLAMNGESRSFEKKKRKSDYSDDSDEEFILKPKKKLK